MVNLLVSSQYARYFVNYSIRLQYTSTCLTRDSKDCKKGKGSPYSITERRVPELIPVFGSQPVGDVNHKPDGRLPLFSATPAVTPATLKRLLREQSHNGCEQFA